MEGWKLLMLETKTSTMSLPALRTWWQEYKNIDLSFVQNYYGYCSLLRLQWYENESKANKFEMKQNNIHRKNHDAH